MASAIRKRLESFFNRKTKESPFFMRNGGALMEKVISLSNGRDEIQMKRFSIKDITDSTNNLSELAFDSGEYQLFKGNLYGRPILVAIWTWNDYNSCIFGTSISALMSHLKNTLKLIGCCLDMEFPAGVYEYARTRMLSDFYPEPSLSWCSRIKIARDIASMVVYLHTCFPMPIIHRDIKASDVLIDEDGVVKLVGFSLALQLPKGESELAVQRIVGLFPILPREYWMSGIVSTKTDVYAFGILLFNILTGRNKMDCRNSVSTDNFFSLFDDEDRILTYVGQFGIIDPTISHQVGIDEFKATKDLVLSCMKLSSEERPEMIDVARRLHQIQKAINKSEDKVKSPTY